MTSNNAGTGLSVWNVDRQTGALTQLIQYGLNGNAVGLAYAAPLDRYYEVIHTGELYRIDADLSNRTLLDTGLGDNSGLTFALPEPFAATGTVVGAAWLLVIARRRRHDLTQASAVR